MTQPSATRAEAAPPNAAPPDADSFRRALRPLVGQVSVLTLLPQSGQAPMGMTLTSAYALSTAPAMVIACINRSASMHASLRVGGVIGWQVLGADMQALAEGFSGQGGLTGAARFAGAQWWDEPHAAGAARLLHGATLACAAQIDSLNLHATHSVLVAQLLSLHSAPEAGSLAYREGAYLPLRG